MSNEIKISLTINLEGELLCAREPETIFYTIKNIENKKKGKPEITVTKGEYKHYSLVAKPASQHINISKDTYMYMTSNECPSFSTPKKWNKMNTKQRLDAHFSAICYDLRGTSYSYEIIE